MRRRGSRWLALVTILLLGGCTTPAFPPGGTGSSVEPDEALHINLYGNVLALEHRNDTLHHLVIDATFVGCEKNATRWSGNAHILSDLPIPQNAEAGVWLVQHARGEQNWTLTTVYTTYAAYAKSCHQHHERDIWLPTAHVDPTEDSTGTATAVPLRGRPIVLGQVNMLDLVLHNRQDEPIHVSLRELTVVNEEAYRQSRVDRAGASDATPPSTSSISGCTIAPQHHDVEVSPNSSLSLRLEVHCAPEADTTPAYTRCEQGHWQPAEAGEEAQWKEGGCETVEPRSPFTGIWGTLSFVDELENLHTRQGILQQGYHLAHDTILTLHAPNYVSDKQDFVVNGTYTDHAGRGVPGGSVLVQLVYPGLENRRFSATYDNTTGEYRFDWADMKEWRPWRWRTGAHAVIVTAEDAAKQEYLPKAERARVVFE